MKPATITYATVQQHQKRGKPLKCHRCGKVFRKGDKAMKTGKSRKYYCQNCAKEMEIEA